MRYKAKNKGDVDKISQSLQKILMEDQTLRVVNDSENRQTLLYGMGEQQLEIVQSMLLEKYKVEIELMRPKVAFRETIRGKSDVEYKYKKQSGGHGQSHGVTHGAWPGYVMPQFGNGNFYAADIDGEDISAYDDKMQTLYDAIKEAEDSSASYSKGLFLISKEKAGFTEWREPGSGNYWQALKEAAMNYQSFGAADGIASLGTVNGSNNAWYVYSDGYVYNDENQDYDFVVAPAFNLDLSKIEIVGDEIIIMHKENFKDEEK